MEINIRYSKVISAILILVLSIGCSGFQQRPELAKQKSSISVIADASIIEDILGVTDGVYIHKNMEVGEAVVKAASSRLKEKGYEVKEDIVSTIGAWLKEGAEYKVVQDDSPSSAPKLFGDTSKPPFYINEIFLKDEKLSQSLISVYRKIYPASMGGHPALMKGSLIIPEAKDLGLKGDALLIIGVMGKQGSASKEIAVGIGSVLSGGGGGGSVPQSYMHVWANLIDLSSGEVILVMVESSGSPLPDKANALVHKIMNGFPVRK